MATSTASLLEKDRSQRMSSGRSSASACVTGRYRSSEQMFSTVVPCNASTHKHGQGRLAPPLQGAIGCKQICSLGLFSIHVNESSALQEDGIGLREFAFLWPLKRWVERLHKVERKSTSFNAVADSSLCNWSDRAHLCTPTALFVTREHVRPGGREHLQ